LKEVVDTRFLVEHFYSNQIETRRKTSKKLEDLIKNKEGLLPTIAICEAVQVTCEKRGKEEAETRFSSLARSRLEIQNLNQETAKVAALLKCRYKGTPIGDCIIAATAIINNARVLSDDPHFDTIKEIRRSWI